MLAVCLLGPVSASIDEAPLRLTRPLERALLARLAMSPGLGVDAPRLLVDLWTELPERGLASLHTLVWRLRHTLGPEGAALAKAGSGYALAVDPTTVDVCRFEELATRGRARYETGRPAEASDTLGAALGLWRGPALADVGDVPYALAQRARLEEWRQSVLELWVQANLDCGRHSLVIGELEAALADQPLREALWAKLILALYRCGRQGDALGAYQRLRQLLGDELGVDPSAPLVALEDAVLRQSPELDWTPPSPRLGARLSAWGDPHSSLPPLPSALAVEASRPFVGRNAELDLAERLLSDPTRNRLAVLWVVGEPGIGKTRLATEIAFRAHSAGDVVVFGRCEEDLAGPYQPFIEALQWYVSRVPNDELVDRLGDAPAELIRLVPKIGACLPGLVSPRSTSPELDQHRLFEAVRSWIAVAGGGRPLVVVLDDVHWASSPTLSLLGHVARSAEASRALLVCTARNTFPDENEGLAALVGELKRRGVPSYTMQLPGLNHEAVAELVESMTGRQLDDGLRSLATQLHGDTAGNPLFVTTVLANRTDEPAQAFPQLHPSLAGTIDRRVARLPGEAAELLRFAAVAGLEFDLRVLAMASGRDELVALESLEAAGRAGLVDEDAPNHYRFRHALVRSAVREQMSRSRSVRVHLQVGEALEAFHRDRLDEHASELAYHFWEAVPAGAAPSAFRYLLLAAERATRLLSHGEAVAAYGQALELLDQEWLGPPFRHDLLLARGEALRRAGDVAAALSTLRAAAIEADAHKASEQLGRAAVAFEETNYWLGSTGDPALGLLKRAEEALPPEDSPLRALTLASLSRALSTSDGSEGIERRDEARAMAERLGDPAATFAVAFRTTGSTLSVREASDSAPRWLELCAKAREFGDDDSYLLALGEAMLASAMLGDLQTWEHLFADLARLALEINQPRWNSWLDVHRAFRAILAADLERAELLLERAEQVGRGFGWSREGLYGVEMFLIRREQGRLRGLAPVVQAVALLNPAAALWRPGLAALLSELGRLEEARQEFEALVGEGFAGLPAGSTWDLCVSLLAEVCVALGDTERAPWFLELLRPAEGKFLTFLGCAAGLGPTDRLLGMLASMADRPDDAERWHARGLELARRMESPLWIAHCLYDYAVHLQRFEGSWAGGPQLAEAGTICGDHNLAGLAHRLERLGSGDERLLR